MNYKKLIISLLIPQAAGLLGSLATTPNIATWYAGLAKPELNPPNWVFGPVWTLLFILMGVALYLVWNSNNEKFKKQALVVFGAQLTFNVIWSFLFST